ncbi:MAG TPA: hypothetical protein VE959_02265 [Bryobacteraceae bacterium]|nr:hypothetical protein [Bryobacteraceae bacterium]
MDLRIYFKKIRDMEANIADDFAVVVSRETADGGRAGAQTEVPRRTAAKMVVDGLAVLASEAEAAAFRAIAAEAQRVAEQAVAAARVQLTVLTSAELERLKSKSKDKAN